MKGLQIHFILGWLLVIGTLALIGFYIPGKERQIGESYLIFFFHFPSAINCLNFFIFSGILSLIYLVRGKPSFDHWAATAAEIGVLACTITLVTGSIWAKAAWGHWWVMTDPRLMTVAIMWLTYLAYLALRSTIEEPVKRARFCGVFGVLACLNVPLVYFSIQWLGQENHPMNVELGARAMVITRWFGALAFFVLYSALWRMRARVLEDEYEVHRLEAEFTKAGF